MPNRFVPTLDVDAIAARAAAASEGPWVYADDVVNDDGSIQSANVLVSTPLGFDPWQVAAAFGGSVDPDDGRDEQASANAEFISGARQDVPALVAEVLEWRFRDTPEFRYQNPFPADGPHELVR